MTQFQSWLFLSALMTIATCCQAQEAADAEKGFDSLFNGTDLTGWDGDERFWRVEDGAIIGETSENNKAEHNTFLIHPDDSYGDFELRFSYQVRGFNSGVQYRSVAKDDYVVSGYQADFEDRWHDGTTDKFSGMFFEEKGRMFLGQRGEAVIVKSDGRDPKKPVIERIGSVGDPIELEKAIHRDGWNDYVIIASGFQFTHIINGKVMAVGWDQDTKNRRSTGIFAFQLHSGPPMQIKIKNIRVRKL